MTVGEMILALARFPQEMRVLVSGYEGGLADPKPPVAARVDLDSHNSSVYGPHAREGDGWDKPSATVEAVLIER